MTSRFSHRVSYRLSRTTLLVLALLSMLHQPARASNDGKLCEGWNILICIPLFAVAVPLGALVEAVKTKSLGDQLWSAVQAGDLEKAKTLFARHGELKDSSTARDVVAHQAANYLRIRDETRSRDTLAFIGHLLDAGVDVSGTKGSGLLQATIPDADPQGDWAKRIALAKLAFAHGASAQDVRLSYCLTCDQDPGFLPLMVEHGANLNRADAVHGTLYDNLLMRDHVDAAAQLVRLGADPNGAELDGETVLFRIAERCAPKADVKSLEAWLQCTAQSAKRAEFAIAQGADPNGKLRPETGCVSPHALASERKNELLAETLVRLGANPELAAQCKRSLSPEAIAQFEKRRANRKNCGCSSQAAKPAVPATVPAPTSAPAPTPAEASTP